MFVLDDFLPDVRVLKEAQSLSKLGFHIRIVGTHYDKSLPTKVVVENGIEVIRENVVKLPLLKYAHFWIKGFIRHKSYPAAIVVCHDLSALGVGWLFKHNHKIKLVYDSHELWPSLIEETKGRMWFWIFTALERWLIRYPDLITSPNMMISKLILHFYSVQKPIDYIYNVPPRTIMDIPLKSLQRKDNEILFVLIGNITPVGRGIEVLPQTAEFIKLLRKPTDPLIRIILIGKGEFRKVIEKKIKQKGNQDIIQFIGHYPQQEALALTKSCDIGLILTPKIGLNMTYALPNRFFDYMGCNLPILSTDIDILASIIKNERVGWIVPSNDAKALAEKMLYIVRNKQEITEIKQRLPKIFMEKYNWDVMDKKVQKMYLKLQKAIN